jgi:phosphoribosylformimino-5-aminoimidazole carboxamide ribotide isomerase
LRVIGVLDLARGLAVRATGGRREQYAPVTVAAGSRSPIQAGDAVALARAYIDDLQLRELYVADLDAISGGALQHTLITGLISLGVPIWLDAGVSSINQASRVVELGAEQVVVGLETLHSFDALAAICGVVGGDRVAFSLDLRNGQPLMRTGLDCPRDAAPGVLAARAAQAGVASMIVIDLARVGGRVGLDLDMIAAVRAAVPRLTLLAGGGVRGAEDLAQLAHAGCDGALVATALGLLSAGGGRQTAR